MAANTQTQNRVKTFDGNILGREVHFEYSALWIVYAVVGLRVVMGWIFLQAGYDKITADPKWTAEGFLKFAIPENNPFRDTFMNMAGNGLVDNLNVYGQILIGLCLILGLFTRGAAVWGAIMMLFYWAASLTGGLGDFLPLEHGWVVDDHMVYAVLLFGIGALGAGRILGLDALIEKTEFVQKNSWLKTILG